MPIVITKTDNSTTVANGTDREVYKGEVKINVTGPDFNTKIFTLGGQSSKFKRADVTSIDGVDPSGDDLDAYTARLDAAFPEASSGGALNFTDDTRPDSPVEGKPYYNTDSHKEEFYNGTVWNTVSYTATPALTAPATIAATAGDSQLSVAFALSSNATGYKIEVSADNFTTIAATNTGSGSPIVVTGLTNGTAYKSRVRATAVGYVHSGWRPTTVTTTPQVSPGYNQVLLEGHSLIGQAFTTYLTTGAWGWQFVDEANAYPGLQNCANLAIAGSVLTDIYDAGNPTAGAARRATILAAKDSGAVINYIIIQLLVNDVYQQQSGATTIMQRLEDVCTWATSNGLTPVIVCDTYERQTGHSPTLQASLAADMDTINADIRANYVSRYGAAFVIDMTTSSVLGGYAAPLETRYFMPDHVHYRFLTPTLGGQTGALEVARNALSLLASTTPPTPQIVGYIAPSTTISTTWVDPQDARFTYTSGSGTWLYGAMSGAPYHGTFNIGYNNDADGATITFEHTFTGRAEESIIPYLVIASGCTVSARISNDNGATWSAAIDMTSAVNSVINPTDAVITNGLPAGTYLFEYSIVGHDQVQFNGLEAVIAT